MSGYDSHDEPHDDTPGDDTPGDAGERPARPRPSPRASAASRARRIGGAVRAGAPDRDDRPEAAAPPERPAADPEPAQVRSPRRRTVRRWVRWAPAGMAGVAFAVLLGCCIALSHGVWWAKPSVAGERDHVLAAAKSCFATMNTYDYRSLDKAQAAGERCATPAMAAQYRKAFTTQIRPRAAKARFTQTAQVNKAGVESVSRDGSQWVLLVFGQLQITNATRGPDNPRLDVLTAQVTMDRVHGRWLVASYDYA